MCKTALCLAGGGSRGSWAFGALKAIKERNIKPDTVYAASVGTLNGIKYLQDEMEDLEELWLNIRNKDVYNKRIFSLWKLFTSDASIYDSTPLEKLIIKSFNKEKIDSLNIPFMVGTSNITHLRPEIKDIRNMSYDAQIKWIKASSSPPILFPSITTELGELVDSGICTNYFLSEAVKDGHDLVICISPTNVPPKEPTNLVDIIQSTISTATFNYLDREMAAIEKINKIIDIANIELEHDLRKIKLVLIRPTEKSNIGLLDFDHKYNRKEIINNGYEFANKVLDKLI